MPEWLEGIFTSLGMFTVISTIILLWWIYGPKKRK